MKRKRVVIVDDSVSYCDLWSNFILERYEDRAQVETYNHPYEALPKIEAAVAGAAAQYRRGDGYAVPIVALLGHGAKSEG